MKNLKTLALSLLLLITFTSCQKGYDYEQILAENKAASAKYLAEKEAEGYIKRQSGLLYKISEAGTEPKIVVGDKVVAHYTLMLPSGEVIESTVAGAPYEFKNSTDYTIKGFVEGMTLFGKGGKGVIILPSELAYGNTDVSGIGPAQALTFAIEIVDVNPKK